MIDDLQKENFGLKMQIYFLEDTLAQSSPDGLAQIQKEVRLIIYYLIILKSL